MATYSLKIGGEAGMGIKSTGLNVAKVAMRSGYKVFTYSEYPSLIRGGHNVMQIVWSDETATTPIKTINFLVAMDQKTIDQHRNELIDQGGIIYDPDKKINTVDVEKYRLFPVPLLKLAKESGGGDIVSNTVAVGAMLGLMGGELKHLMNLMADSFADKNESVTKINQTAAQMGYDYVLTNFAGEIEPIMKPLPGRKSNEGLINGNLAVAMGAIEAGMQFASIYPMTPITTILEILAKYQKTYGFIYKQPEDEIAAINMAIGASWGGARAMTATSGGGYCLMTEGLGLAGITETPLVVIEGMRGGPSTGLPTWTEQGDLRLVLNGHHSDIPQLVLAAGDAQEAFYMTREAFNLADRYQTPVIIIVDKDICECEQSFEEMDHDNYQIDRGKLVGTVDSEYQRYALSADGISPRAIPGDGNYMLTNSDEHDTYGYDNEEIDNRNLQMTKRMQKMRTVAIQETIKPHLFGSEEAALTIVSWGSTKGSILEAMKELPEVNFVQIKWISPFPTEELKSMLAKSKIILNIETNSTAQMGNLITEKTGIKIEHNLLKNDGRPIYPEEIVAKVRSLIDKS